MTRLLKLTAAAIVCGLTLAACGGGGDDTRASSTGGGGSSNPTGGGGTGGGSSGGGGGSDSGSQPQTASYTVTPSVSGSGGTISPMAPAPVPSGTIVSFTLAPASGYTVGPVNGTCGGTLSGNTYTTVAITANCTVEATFTASSTARTFSYETQPAPDVTLASSSSDFLALLNQEGAKGYFYQGSWFYSMTQYTFVGGIWVYSPADLTFVNDGSGQTYSYELLVQPGNMADFVAQVNMEGAKGYRFEVGDFLFAAPAGPVKAVNYAVYRKDSGSSATYAYVAGPASSSASDFLAQANQRGQAGYALYPYPPGTIASQNNLYVKSNASNATYAYEAPALPATMDGIFAQMNSEGARGYWALSYYSNMALPVMLYVKDQTQAATFIYKSEAANAPTLDQESSYGAQNYAYWGSIVNIPSVSGSATTYFVKASNCSGWMCTAPTPTANVAYVSTGPIHINPLTGFSYEMQPAPDVTSASGSSNFLALLNREGAKGYFYGDSWFYNVNGLTFVNDNSGRTYSYELLVQPGNMADFLTQANAEGAKGYHYEIGNSMFKTPAGPVNYVVYRKDSGSSATYAYVADLASTSAADLLAQANQWGQAGYWLYPYPPGTSASQNNLYVKDNTSSATYAYEAPALPATMDDLFAQMNSEGTRGYFALSYYYNMALPVMLYVKDQTQTAIFSYQSSAPSATLLDQGNNYGAQGFAYWGSMVDLPSVSGSGAWYYVKAGNCNGGWMCTAPTPTANVAYASTGPVPRPVTGP